VILVNLAFTLFMVGLVASRLQARYALAPSQRAHGPLFTFVVDPLTFFLVGLFSVLVSGINRKGRQLTQQEFRGRKKVLDTLFIIFVLGFWAMEVGTYFDLINVHQGVAPGKSGNWFMWNGYLDKVGIGQIVDTTVPTYKSVGMNALALLLLAIQLPCLIWGRAMGYNVGFFLDWNNWSRPKKKPVVALAAAAPEAPAPTPAVAQAPDSGKAAEAKNTTA
jgi:hypothetical protein